MNCRQCGTEIADKAIVCYRCGIPTAPTRAQAPSSPRAWPQAVALLGFVFALVAAALLLVPLAPAGLPRVLAYTGLALVALLLARLVFRSRLRRR